MNVFSVINTNRIENGYIHKNLRQYNRFCNKMFKKYADENNNLSLVYKAESNLTKYLIFKSIRFLYKAIRVLKKSDLDIKDVYLEYITCFKNNHIGILDINDLVRLRHKLANYYAFLDDIYNLADNRHDFDQYKINYKWHDISVLFETQELFDEFLSGKFFIEDHRFNTQMALRILKFEESKKIFLEKLTTDNLLILELFDKSKILLNTGKQLKLFLEENFIESKYVNQMYNAVSEVDVFITKLLEFKNGAIDAIEYIDNFIVPEYFKEFETVLNSLKAKKTVDTKKLKQLLLKILENNIKGEFKARNTPLLPIFYDLANDYIKYPSEKINFLKSFKSFNFFNKK